jgi:hypothetical protein
MTTSDEPDAVAMHAPAPKHHRVRLPGFIKEDIALGDAIKRATSYAGIQPCGGCNRRAEALNQWMVFSPRRR